MTDYRSVILKELKKHLNNEIENNANKFFKVRAYKKVILQIEQDKEPITSEDDLKRFTGIGKGMKERLVKVFEMDPQDIKEQSNSNTKTNSAIDELQKVHGIGLVKAKDLVLNHQIYDLKTLRENEQLLNKVQLAGLKYVEHFEKRIPRAEMDKHYEIITRIFNRNNFSKCYNQFTKNTKFV